MEQFSLDKYLENPSRKVVTRDGRSVRIICTDAKSELPIIALVPFDDSEDAYHYNKNGVANGFESITLFFADEEKLTEFESKLADLLVYNHPMDIESAESIAKKKSKRLLDLARKEILESLPKWKKTQPCEKYIHNKGYYITWTDLEKLPKEE